MAFARITSDPSKMAGVPCIRGLRFPVATVVAMVADGITNEEILSEHPDLEAEDISEALRFAALAVQERQMLDDDRVRIRGLPFPPENQPTADSPLERTPATTTLEQHRRDRAIAPWCSTDRESRGAAHRQISATLSG